MGKVGIVPPLLRQPKKNGEVKPRNYGSQCRKTPPAGSGHRRMRSWSEKRHDFLNITQLGPGPPPEDIPTRVDLQLIPNSPEYPMDTVFQLA